MILQRLNGTSCVSLRRLSQRRRREFSSLQNYLQVDKTVEEALKNGEPIVALESTIVAHGMPFPQNLETAQSVESIVQSKGAVPATIAVKNGVCHVGLTGDELEDLARAGEEKRAQKCSTRELSLILARHRLAENTRGRRPHQWGATTVASTMALAHTAKIDTFVTGGIGGVHRGVENTMDISADLTELSRTPVVVVSAGIKSILDIPRTLEVLETNGVPTVAFQADEFPCFFSPNSGIMAPARVDSAVEVASAFSAARALNFPHGMLVAVPPPNSAGESIEQAIQEALEEANKRGLHGQAVTPFILKRVAETTGGDSLRCNISLVQNNAQVGSEIAVAIAEQKNSTSVGILPSELPRPSPVIVMGGTVLDIVAKPKSGALLLGTSNPADCTESDGGVARNVAEVLGRLGSKPLLYSAVGHDARGLALQRRQSEYGIQDSHMTIHVVEGSNTATYLAVLEGETNDLHTACADMAVMSDIQKPPRELLSTAKILLVDANPPIDTLRSAACEASDLGVDVYFEPTSVPKAQLAAHDAAFLRALTGAFPNLSELIAMRDAACGATGDLGEPGLDIEEIRFITAQVLSCMSPKKACLVVTMGSEGVLLATKKGDRQSGDESDPADYQFRHFPVVDEVEVQNSTGAGDTLAGAFLHALLEGKDESEAVSWGMQAAALSLQSSDRTISPELSKLRIS
ncbi:Pseudouridine-5'-phosphate glycosidase [Seminavis robusta]|uniref:Pseudouridine-5'-phosphate glycosidase n=1 Tax=Seminavis robusta TaxID=568900 RepID=A0A9N8HBV6_9STRA|nr:Pseudouridine-5'-phosphate glycosidase [Seminavis robusta]|eukprot:Sro294_g110110.1 Pseudouridine-5'-phosphate glycosidase (691) ;mRNA; f:1854-4110